MRTWKFHCTCYPNDRGCRHNITALWSDQVDQTVSSNCATSSPNTVTLYLPSTYPAYHNRCMNQETNSYKAFYAISITPKTLFVQLAACCVLHAISSSSAGFWDMEREYMSRSGPQTLDFYKLKYPGVFGSSTATQVTGRSCSGSVRYSGCGFRRKGTPAIWLSWLQIPSHFRSQNIKENVN